MKIPVNMPEVTRIVACVSLTFAAYHILDIVKAAVRAKYAGVELLIALAGVCIYAVAYVARGNNDTGGKNA